MATKDTVEVLEKPNTENNIALPSTSDTKLERPRKIIFTINAYINEDEATFDGRKIAGKNLGDTPFKFNFPLREDEGGNYVTGFDLEMIEMDRNIPEDQKQQLLKDVKIATQYLERKYRISLGSNSPFWKGKKLRLDDLGLVYDTSRNDDHLILFYNIIGGGYPEVGASFEDAKAKGLKMYVAVAADEAERSFNHRSSLLSANGALDKFYKEGKLADILFLTYYLIKRPHGYTLSTPKETLINELADFVEAIDAKSGKKKRPQEFLDAVSLLDRDPDKLKITAVFNAADYYGFITSNKDRTLENRRTGFQYGSSVESAIDKLLDPRNIEELSYIKGKVNEKWIS